MRVGDSAIVVIRGGDVSYVTVAKVGRRWITFRGSGMTWRSEIGSNQLDGGRYSSPGRVYASLEAYHEWRELNAEWRSLSDRVSKCYMPPEGLTIDNLREARRLLRVDR